MNIKYKDQFPQLMQELKLPMVAVHIGAGDGVFAYNLMLRGIDTMYLVDTWEYEDDPTIGYTESWFLDNLKQARDRMVAYDNSPKKYMFLQGSIEEMSDAVLDNSIGLLYIEAELTNDSKWYDKVVKGGIIVTGDINYTIK